MNSLKYETLNILQQIRVSSVNNHQKQNGMLGFLLMSCQRGDLQRISGEKQLLMSFYFCVWH